MGWARSLFYPSPIEHPTQESSKDHLKSPYQVDHVENINSRPVIASTLPPELGPRNGRGFLRIPSKELFEIASGGRPPVDEEDLPFIEPSSIESHTTLDSGIWIVIEDRVYDVSTFTSIHPGGPSMFEQFGGKQCTWQFWRFHRKQHLADWSCALLIGRTWPIPPNPYKEPPKWIKTS